jgi:hypothetical protein
MLVASAAVSRAAEYDPLVRHPVSSKSIELTVKDDKRSREIPIRVFLPDDSHGLGGSGCGSSYLGEHWAARGQAEVCLKCGAVNLSLTSTDLKKIGKPPA